MTVAVFVINPRDVECLIPWGIHFALAEHTELLVVCPQKSKGKRGWESLTVSDDDEHLLHRSVFDVLKHQDPQWVVLKQDIAAGNESSNMDRVAVEIRELTAPDPELAFIEEIGSLGIATLLLPAHDPVKGRHEDDLTWPQILFSQAPCRVISIRGQAPDLTAPLKILVAAQKDIDADEILALTKAEQLVKHSHGTDDANESEVTILYVRPDDDVVAQQVAEQHLEQLKKNTSGKAIALKSKIELADTLCQGINRLSLDSFDLIVVGTRNAKTIRALLRDLKNAAETSHFALATMRESVPFSNQIWSRIKQAVRGIVPQLDRSHRVKLVDRLQSQSRFDFDFVALISLSTLIAALGLAKNSGAVVIGAMLVAPLMTPLVAIGFALVQGNIILMREALKSVALGFSVAFGIGLTVGLVLRLLAPDFPIVDEMTSRGLPNLLDLVVALASGVAGAYAMGRPHLISAIPGVAIAAALVPPIATSGLALAMGAPSLSGGASLLFLTNIVAIVLGTAITFWAVGINSRLKTDRRSARDWPRYVFFGFVVLSFILAYFFSPIVVPSPPTANPAGSNTLQLMRVD